MIKYVDYSAEKIKIDNFYDKVAFVAHNCYQVNANKDNVAFIKRLVEANHLAMIEHYVFHLIIESDYAQKLINLQNKYILITRLSDEYLVSLSLRPLLENQENELLSSLIYALPEEVKNLFKVEFRKSTYKVKYIEESKLDELKVTLGAYYDEHKFISIRIITDRGVTHELVRHRPCSFAQESTRYCNYSKQKFGNSITLIKPLDYDKYKDIYDKYYQECEDGYFAMLNNGATPDVARAILPNGLKTCIIITASIKEWNHIFELRTAFSAHPDMRETMKRVKEVIDD